jgi:hypothetical protein
MATPAPAAASPAPINAQDPVDLLEVPRQSHPLTPDLSSHPSSPSYRPRHASGAPGCPLPRGDAVDARCPPPAPQEDDEFEEFEQQDFSAAPEDAEDPAMWQDGWEDDEDDEQFTAALRAELDASESSAKPAAMQQ